MSQPATIETLRWVGDAAGGQLVLIDQTRLPDEFVELVCRDVRDGLGGDQDPAHSRRAGDRHGGRLRRLPGPADGADGDAPTSSPRLQAITDYLAASRPTAVNLFWALARMEDTAASLRGIADPGGNP